MFIVAHMGRVKEPVVAILAVMVFMVQSCDLTLCEVDKLSKLGISFEVVQYIF